MLTKPFALATVRSDMGAETGLLPSSTQSVFGVVRFPGQEDFIALAARAIAI